ncbi:hypothetical protein D9M68_359280 [compost metagenome]
MAGEFHADRRACETIFERFFGQQAHRPHHVAEVEACRGNRDDDFTRTCGGNVALFPDDAAHLRADALTDRCGLEGVDRRMGVVDRAGHGTDFGKRRVLSL